ncbi:MAG: succinate dehydrogenase, hydrophobic membrane anchor protein [Steroidobacteraceae bacterium]|nr:succinate dehydrogenase, hydrophobic membrane anchor protein [Steroidobacteraceae bacterium]
MDESPRVGMRSPLGRVTGLGSAKDGTGHWWAQRLSALALVPLASWLLISILTLPNLGYAAVHDWLSRPLEGFLAALCTGTLTYHSYLGTTVVVEDYVHGRAAKLLSLIGLKFMHVLVGGAGIFAILRLTMGTLVS